MAHNVQWFKGHYCEVFQDDILIKDNLVVGEYLEQAVVESPWDIRKVEKLNGLTPVAYDELPTGGWIEQGKLYQYNSSVVQCIQGHTRTIYAPEETPALFSFYREDTGSLEWVANEKVVIGDRRLYNAITYECIQSHMTLEGWTPDITLALWKLAPTEEIPDWVQPTGAHDAYNTGDKVRFNGQVYESRINANVWSPAVYPAGWQLIT